MNDSDAQFMFTFCNGRLQHSGLLARFH